MNNTTAMSKRLKIRKIGLGIRFKFSAIMISAVILVSALIGFALINQYEQKIIATLNRLGSTTLKGIADQAQIYLHAKHILSDTQKYPLTDGQRDAFADELENSLKKMSEYFSSVILKEKLL